METGKIQILLVDDNTDNLVTLKTCIQNPFSEAIVSTALNSQQGLEIMAAEEIDLILLGVIQHEMNEFELCKRLKADKGLCGIPVIFITVDKESRIRALESGAEGFLSIPIDESELIAQIRSMLKIRAANIQKQEEKQLLAALVDEKDGKRKDSNKKSLLSFEAVKAEQTLIEAIFDSIPGYLYVYDETGRLIKWNKKHETMTGYTAEELSHMTLGKWFDQEDIVRVNAAVRDVFQKGYGEVEAQLILKSGEKMMIRSSGAPLILGGQKFFTGIGMDITESKKMEHEIKANEEKFRKAIEEAPIPIMLHAEDGEVLELSRTWRELTGYQLEDIPTIKIWTETAYEPENLEVRRTIGDLYNIEKRQHDGEYPVYTKMGTTLIWDFYSAIIGKLRDGRKIVMSVAIDVTEEKKRQDEMLYVSFHDQLTGLYNRRFYEEELSRLDTARNLPLTLVLCDVNGLKLINDSFGHAVGDQLLVKSAEVLTACCRADDLIARHGGDEFVIVLPKTNSSETEIMLKRIKVEIEKKQVHSIDVSISFGYDTKTDSEQDIKEIFKNAEDHMYRHKLYESGSARSKTVDMIINTLYEKNNREMLHSKRVSELCAQIAKATGMNSDDVNQMRIAGLMHDIGKIGIDENILNKVEKLSDSEWEEIKKHSEIGYRILSSVNEFSKISEFVLEHQEKWDGTGYPKGLKGQEISIEARIIALADAYDAMTGKRTYRESLTKEEAIEEIKKCAGTQFDPTLVKIFLEKVRTKE